MTAQATYFTMPSIIRRIGIAWGLEVGVENHLEPRREHSRHVQHISILPSMGVGRNIIARRRDAVRVIFARRGGSAAEAGEGFSWHRYDDYGN